MYVNMMHINVYYSLSSLYLIPVHVSLFIHCCYVDVLCHICINSLKSGIKEFICVYIPYLMFALLFVGSFTDTKHPIFIHCIPYLYTVFHILRCIPYFEMYSIF